MLIDINLKNCLIYLHEAYKKLKACENSNDMWYLLLNNSMNFVAKNLEYLLENSPSEIQSRINPRITEEVIKRCLMHHRGNSRLKLGLVISYLKKVRKTKSLATCLAIQKKKLLDKTEFSADGFKVVVLKVS